MIVGVRGLGGEAADLEEKRLKTRGIVDRMMAVLAVKTLKELGLKLGLGSRVPSAWLGKGHVPAKVIELVSVMTGKSLDWIRDGVESKGTLSVAEVEAMVAEALEILRRTEKLEMIAELHPESFSIAAKKLVSGFIAQSGLQIDNKTKA